MFFRFIVHVHEVRCRYRTDECFLSLSLGVHDGGREENRGEILGTDRTALGVGFFFHVCVGVCLGRVGGEDYHLRFLRRIPSIVNMR